MTVPRRAYEAAGENSVGHRAGRGIGAAIADALAAEGAAVAACDLDGTAAAKTAAGLAERHGVRAVGVGVDIADSASVRAAVSRVQAELGPPDILVNNAGVDVIELFIDSAEETWDKIIAVNLRGTMTVTRAVLDGMIERGSGRIIHSPRTPGGSARPVRWCTPPPRAASSPSARHWPGRWPGTASRSTASAPARPTPRLFDQVAAYSQKLRDGLAGAVPLRRVGQPADIAPAVAFLASDEAAYITGQRCRSAAA